jgi:hypothetical protein
MDVRCTAYFYELMAGDVIAVINTLDITRAAWWGGATGCVSR